MPTPPFISDTELEVLEALWAERGTTVRAVHAHLRARGRTWAYNTVQTLLNRLSRKGFVRAERSGRVVEYTAAASREELVRRQLEGIAERICGGSPAPLVLSLFEGQSFSPDEIRAFRRLLDDLEAEGEEAGP